jgi:hypothetical protein
MSERLQSDAQATVVLPTRGRKRARLFAHLLEAANPILAAVHTAVTT